MVIGSVARFQEAHGPLCYKNVLGHREHSVVQSHTVDLLVLCVASAMHLTLIVTF